MHSFAKNYQEFKKCHSVSKSSKNIQYSILNSNKQYSGLSMEEVALAVINQTLVVL